MNEHPFCFIVPYRKREEHLAKFVPHYNTLFPRVPIFVVEQFDDKPFNRARLFNACFLLRGHEYNYAAYHDVDMYVVEKYKGEYLKYPSNPVHLCTHASQFQFQLPYPDFFGGVCLITADQMERSNGWSNEFWSRNAEDDEMRNNLIKKGYAIERRTCFYDCDDHARHYDPIHFPKNIALLQKGRDESTDGLNNCKFTWVSTEEKEGYTLFKVKF